MPKEAGVTHQAAPPKPYGELTPEEQANARAVISLGFDEGLKESLAKGSDTFAFEIAGSGDVMFLVMLRPRTEVLRVMNAVEELRAQAVELPQKGKG